MRVKKKIYFVTEGVVDGNTIQSEKFNQIVDPDTNNEMFTNVFGITECFEFEKYKSKNDFLATIFEMATLYFQEFGDVGEISLVAIDAKSNIFQWGVSMELLDDGTFQYRTIDWKVDGKIFKYE